MTSTDPRRPPAGDAAQAVTDLDPTSPGAGPRLARLTDVLAAMTRLGGTDETGGPAAAMPGSLQVGEVLDVWRLVRHLGSGGMGDVYLAERCDGRVEQQVAIKRVREVRPATVERMARELRILARLTHPNVARFLDAGVDARGMPYMVLEYVAGETIDTWCASRRVALPGRLELLIKVCDAVEHAHRHLIVHRDLKPDNVLVDADGAPKLLDFGIAKLLEDTGPATQTANPVMTLVYAAPEQLLGDPVSTTTDVYALGLLAHLLLTGELTPARQAETIAELVARAPFEDVPPPSAQLRQREARGERWPVAARELAGDADAVLGAALQAEPAHRYASVAALREELQRLRDGRPVLARSHSRLYRARRFVVRHRWGVAAATAVLASILGGLGVALWQAAEARAHARRAEAALARAEAVKGFVAEMFVTVDPYAYRGLETPIGALLERTEERLRTQLAGQPDVAAELAEILGESYVSLAANERAATLLELARARNAEASQPLPARDARVRARLAYLAGGDGALAEVERSVAALRGLGAPAREDLAKVLTLEADLLWQRENLDGALAAIDESARLTEQVHGRESTAYWDAVGSQAEYLRLARRFDAAIATAHRATEGLRRTAGADAVPTLLTERVWVNALIDAGRSREALPLLEPLVEDIAAKLGKQHLYYHGTRFVQADALWQLGHLDRAAAAFRELLAVNETDSARNRVTIRQRIGAVELAREDYAAALPELDAAAAFFREELGAEALPSVLVELGRIEALVGLGRRAEARAALDAIAPAARDQELRTVVRWRTLDARLARADRHVDTARDTLQPALARLRAEGQEASLDAVRAWAELGEIERAAGQTAAAREAFKSARDVLAPTLDTATPQLRRLDARLREPAAGQATAAGGSA